MEKRVREWLVSSGSLPTIQARLRADLYAAIQVACLCIVFVESVVLSGYWLHLPNVDSGASLRPGPPPETQRKERQCQPANQVRTKSGSATHLLIEETFFKSGGNPVW